MAPFSLVVAPGGSESRSDLPEAISWLVAVPGFEPLSPCLGPSWLLILWDSVVPLFIGFSSLTFLSYFFSFFFTPSICFLPCFFLSSHIQVEVPGPQLIPPLAFSGCCCRHHASPLQSVPLTRVCSVALSVEKHAGKCTKNHGKVEVWSEGIQGLHGVTWKEEGVEAE